MIEFRTLGAIELRVAGGPELTALLVQPKKLAVLAYLALKTPLGFHRRDTLLPMFWPEADQEHARTSLRKSVYLLRQLLGESLLLSRGDEELSLNFDQFWCDVSAFEQALDSKSLVAGLAHYRGDLLTGLHISGSPAYEEWLEAERVRLRRRAQLALRQLAREMEEAGRYAIAAQWLRKAMELQPDSEGDLNSLVRVLDRAGDRVGALREYDDFARRLAAELGVEPSHQSQSLVQQIRSRSGEPLAVPASASPAAVQHTTPAGSGAPVALFRRSRWKARGKLAALIGLGLMAALLTRGSIRHSVEAPGHVVAVLPFRVTGADSSLAFLREGMVDLLASKLSGTDHLRTVDPRTLLASWRRAGGSDRRDLQRSEALTMARRLGADRILEGEITGTGRRIILNAVLIDAGDGGQIRSTLVAPWDSLLPSIDRLAGELLALGAGEPGHRLEALTSTSLLALREYLEGKSALRRGAYADAVRRFDRALELDTSFAVAGLGRTHAAIWIGELQLGPGSLRAWYHRERLATPDYTFLRFMVGPKFPNRSTQLEWLSATKAILTVSPDDPQAWATVADQTFHYGGLLGISGTIQQSLHAYSRALALDSTYLPAWEHLALLAVVAGNVEMARQVVHLRLQHDSVSPLAKEDHWLGLRVLGDRTLPPLVLTHDSLTSRPGGIPWKAVVLGHGLADADSIVTLGLSGATHPGARKTAESNARSYYLVRGWPSRALEAVEATLSSPDGRKDWLILDALYADGDTSLARKVISQVSQDFTRPTSDQEFLKVLLQYAAAQFELSRGNQSRAERAVRAWLTYTMEPESLLAPYATQYAAKLLDAQLAALNQRPDALARLHELDSILQTGPTHGDFFERAGNLEAARLWHARGETRRALLAVRRRLQGIRLHSEVPRYLREEGRYAAVLGDRVGAARALNHYVVLRAGAERSLQPQLDSVQSELAALMSDARHGPPSRAASR